MSSKKPEQENVMATEEPTPGPVRLRLGNDEVEVESPTVVGNLKSQGWEVVE